ncbi:DUF192 domain-containing protein [Algicella marina]|uniref:DUF192 domain-containing protein n=1 Tax=Algicella marina TaxID=2683284 RepID=A0A6P1SZM8_9RHOB|nr:DUF192 domain-containing protein [Algicella marina]QHQ34975.1 DUF192 domain-containing protein [Algicella marina]
MSFLFLLFVGGTAVADCAPGVAEFRDDALQAQFRVDVVDTVESRARGLMFVEQMGMFEGMLFVYDRPQQVSFWMKNTLIPLDMIFMDAAGVVQKVHANAVPGDLTGIPGGDAIQYVLEINGGVAEELGIRPGAEMRHPAIGTAAAWGCD